eukprot:2625399-Prymnesium_polylepis.2
MTLRREAPSSGNPTACGAPLVRTNSGKNAFGLPLHVGRGEGCACGCGAVQSTFNLTASGAR